jgi:hypothetical protein
VRVFLADLEGRLLGGNIVAPMPIDKNDSAKSLFDRIVHQAAEEIQIDPRGSREGTVEIQVMVGVSHPHHWRKNDAILHLQRYPIDQSLSQERIGPNRKMLSVLLDSSQWKYDRCVWGKGCDRRGLHLVK